MRRVVVTGLGAVTPLGVGVRQTWHRLLANESGIVSVASRQPQARWRELTSTVAGVVPCGEAQDQWNPADWLSATEQRRTSTFAQYALAASDMALKDAGWKAAKPEHLEATGVCLGSGIGNLDDIYETSLSHHNGVSSAQDQHLCLTGAPLFSSPAVFTATCSSWQSLVANFDHAGV